VNQLSRSGVARTFSFSFVILPTSSKFELPSVFGVGTSPNTNVFDCVDGVWGKEIVNTSKLHNPMHVVPAQLANQLAVPHPQHAAQYSALAQHPPVQPWPSSRQDTCSLWMTSFVVLRSSSSFPGRSSSFPPKQREDHHVNSQEGGQAKAKASS